MKFLIIGHGAREHAIVNRLINDGHSVVVCASKLNPGLIAACQSFVLIENYESIDVIIKEAALNKVDMILPCDETALFAGIADIAETAGIACLGHYKDTSLLLEKQRYAVILALKSFPPVHPPTGVVATSQDDITGFDKIVIKPLQAVSSVPHILFASVGDDVPKEYFPAWVEPYTPGIDFSLHYLTSAHRFYFLGTTLDYPMLSRSSDIVTGGMGSIALPEKAVSVISEHIIQQCKKMTEDGLHRLQANHPTRLNGFVSAQFRKTSHDVVFTEFDCKPGNPEMVALLPLIEGDLGELLFAAQKGVANEVKRRSAFSVALTMSPIGYPYQDARLVCHEIQSDILKNTNILLGDISEENGRFSSGTSRTLCIVETSPYASIAISKAIGLASKISALTGLVFRDDIGSNMEKPTASQRVQKSLSTLKERGGKRLMLRLTPDALLSLQKIMKRDGYKTETAAINETLLEYAKNFVNK